MKVDRGAPDVTLSGLLNDRAGQALDDGSHPLHIVAADGDGNQNPRSGVKSIEVFVDNQPDPSGQWTRSCDANTGCDATMTQDYSFRPSALGLKDGRHTIKVVAKDPLGHATERTIEIIYDHSPPSTPTVQHTNLPSEWVEAADPSVTASASDRGDATPPEFGTGIKRFALTKDDGGEIASDSFSCAGTIASRCPESGQKTLSYSSSGLPEGSNTLSLRAYDAITPSHASAPATWQLKIDRSAPEQLTLAGSLKNRENQDLAPGSYDLQVQARDGDASNPAMARSGMATIEIVLDGELVDYVDQDCTAAAGSCPLNHTWTFNTADHRGGQHLLEVTAIDQLGHERKTSFRFGTACCFNPPGAWGSASALLDDVALGDVNADGAADAVIQNKVTGEVRVAPSTGSSFGPAVPWGTFPALHDLLAADVTGDGRDDLVGRHKVTGAVTAAPSTGAGFAAPATWAASSSPQDFRVADVTGDGKGDLVGRDTITDEVQVAVSTGAAFGPRQAWATLADAYELHVGDADGDELADLIAYQSQTGEVRVGVSTGSAFSQPVGWGNFDPQYVLRIEDMDGDGLADLVGRNERPNDPQAGELRVALSNATSFDAPSRWGSWSTDLDFRVADVSADTQGDVVGRFNLSDEIRAAVNNAASRPEPLGDTWQPAAGTQYDAGDDLQPLDPSQPVQSEPVTASRHKPPPQSLRIGFLDPDVCRSDSDAALRDNRFRQAGARVKRLSLNWGTTELKNGSYVWDPDLDREVTRAATRDPATQQAFTVLLTIQGSAERECANPNWLACQDGGTGRNPDITKFRNFVQAAVQHFKNMGDVGVHHYSIWNEPNFTRYLAPETISAARLYRRLYRAGYDGVKTADSSARVFLGELAPDRRGGKTAIEFLRDVVQPESGEASSTKCQTHATCADGVAWHPYQHRAHPKKKLAGHYGIGRLDDIQSEIRTLQDTRDGSGRRLLATAGGNDPRLYLTEFGYLNRPIKPGGSGYYSERTRAGYYRLALRYAWRSHAKWIIFHQPVEPDLEPGEGVGDAGFKAKEDYGLLARPDVIGGERPYGKGSNPGLKNPQQRHAYCSIWRWTERWKYHTVNNNCPAILHDAGFE